LPRPVFLFLGVAAVPLLSPFSRVLDNHPVVVFRAGKEPIPAGMKTAVWIRGTCLGRVDDGKNRHLPGYTFKVVVVDCRVVSPPTAVGP
jgi:hypothetical protein